MGRSRGLSGWPIRRKLATLVTPPLLIIFGGGALLGVSAVQTLRDAQRARALANTITASSAANLALQQEINQAIIGSATAEGNKGPSANDLARLETLVADTDEERATLFSALQDQPAGGWSDDVTTAIQALSDDSDTLAAARKSARSARNFSFAQTQYDEILVGQLTLLGALARDLTTATDDPRLSNAATTISAMSGLASAASSERTEGAVLLSKEPVIKGDKISPQSLGNFLSFIEAQRVQNETAQRFATPAARTLLTDAQQTDAETLDQLRSDVVALADKIPPETALRLGKARSFSETAGQRLTRIARALTQMANDTADVAGGVATDALIRTAGVVGIALLALVLVALFAASIARTVTLPLRRLRSAAVEAATVRLPAAVRQIERQGPDAVPALPPVLPPGAPAGPETVEVAQAVDGLTTEALRLATAQVRLRQAIDEAFVSMSRRSQSMVEKQLSIIDELESTEEDPDQLRNLFRLDHLAARMRRYNDNLLVLAGSTVRTRSAAPVPVADVFRAATSEMEQYERVRLQPISGTAIAGPAAGGLIHLLAELLDNAAMYSPPTSPILLTAAYMPDGGLHLEVTDSGVGIPPNELAELNARLSSPGTLDAQVPSRMGLFVVARLAQRGGLRVRLSPRSNTAGTVAEVMVPAALVAGSSGTEAAPATFGDMPSTPSPVPGPAGSSAPSAPSAPSVPATPAAPPERSPAPAPAPRRPAAARADAGTTGPATTGNIPKVTGGGAPLPSRRPGAVLGEGPLAASSTPRPPAVSMPTPPHGSPGLFGVAAATSGNPFEPTNGKQPEAESREPREPREAPKGRPPARGATAAWSPPPGKTLPARPRGTAVPPGAFGGLMTPGTSSARPASDSPTSVPPAPGSLDPAARSDRTPGSPTSRANERTGPATDRALPGRETPASAAPPPPAPPAGGGLPRRTRGASAPPPLMTGAAGAAGASARRDRSEPPVPRSERPAEAPAPEPTAPPVKPANNSQTPLSQDASALTGEMPMGGRDLPTRAKGTSAPLPPVSRSDDNGRSGAAAPSAWDPALPGDLAARASADATAQRYRPANPHAPMIGSDAPPAQGAPTPIFDSISVWFETDSSAPTTGPIEVERVVDLRGDRAPVAAGTSSNRWAALGDQQWLAASARAAAAPEISGTTQTGLPMRRPGANLVPSAAGAVSRSGGSSSDPAPTTSQASGQRADPEAIRGRLGSYQRGLTSARRSRRAPGNGSDALFGPGASKQDKQGQTPDAAGGDR